MKKYAAAGLICLMALACKKNTVEDTQTCTLSNALPCDTLLPVTSSYTGYVVQEADFNPANANQMLYLGHRPDANLYELRVVDGAQCTDTHIFSGPGPISNIDWSANGRIVYSSQGQFYTLNADGSNPQTESFTPPAGTPLSFTPDRAVWSPDGQRILCSGYENGAHHIVIKTIATQQLQDIYPVTGLNPNYEWYANDYLGFSFDSGTGNVKRFNLNTLAYENMGMFAQQPAYFDFNTANGQLVWTPIFLPTDPKPIYSLDMQAAESTQISPGCSNRNFSRVKVSANGQKVLAICGYRQSVDQIQATYKQVLVLMNIDGTGEQAIHLPQ